MKKGGLVWIGYAGNAFSSNLTYNENATAYLYALKLCRVVVKKKKQICVRTSENSPNSSKSKSFVRGYFTPKQTHPRKTHPNLFCGEK